MLPQLSALRHHGWVLYGGTAVALQLGHRQSVDFDFFSDKPLIEEELLNSAPILRGARTVQRAPRTWTVLAGSASGARSVKLSFFGDLRFGRVGQPSITEQAELAIASLDDLFGHKLKVLLQRIEAKDYLDIVAMLRAGQALEHGLGAAQTLSDTFAAMEALRTLTYFEGGDLARVGRAERQLLIDAASRVGEVTPLPLLSSAQT